jgi:hypothetical protein
MLCLALHFIFSRDRPTFWCPPCHLSPIGLRYPCVACDVCFVLNEWQEVWFVHNGLEPGTSLRPNFEREEAMILDSNDLLKSSASANRWIVSKSKRSTKAVMEELKAEGYMNVATCFTEKSVSMYGADMTSKKVIGLRRIPRLVPWSFHQSCLQ